MSVAVERETVNLNEAATMLGISIRTAKAELADTGELAGVPVIRIRSRVLIPKAPLMRVLSGLPVSEVDHEG